MYRDTTAFAALTASLESRVEPIEPMTLKKSYGMEALDEAEASERMQALHLTMADEQRRLNTAGALQGALESMSEPLSPFQAQMASAVAKRIGLKLAHERHGFSLESYSGPRGRTMLRASTEGFKEWWKEFLANLVKLWKRFCAWIKTFFDRRFVTLRTIRSTLNSEFQRRNLKNNNVWRGKPEVALDAFTDMDGKLDVKGLVGNTIKTFDSVCGSDYLVKVQSYGQQCMQVAEKIVTAEGNSWRKLVDDVRAVRFPIPDGFHEEKANGNEASYSSDFLIGRSSLEIKTGRGEQMQGHRGMGEYTAALADSDVSAYVRRRPVKDGLFGNLGDSLKWFDKHGAEDYKLIVQLVDKAIASESRVRPFLKSSDDTLRAVEALEKKTASDDAEKPQLSLASKLLTSVQKSDKAAAALLDNLLSLAINAGIAGQHLKIREA
jgi:hypothetical protein